MYVSLGIQFTWWLGQRARDRCSHFSQVFPAAVAKADVAIAMLSAATLKKFMGRASHES
jgi:hypothetical protein